MSSLSELLIKIDGFYYEDPARAVRMLMMEMEVTQEKAEETLAHLVQAGVIHKSRQNAPQMHFSGHSNSWSKS